jgi:hypothetical protein
VSLPAPVAGLRVIPIGFEHTVVAVPSNLDRDDASELSMLAERPLLTLPRRRNPAFYDALIMALQIAGLSGALLEIDAASVEPLLMEVACGTGCALVQESVIARLRTPGVSFRRLGRTTPVGCISARSSATSNGTQACRR